MRDRIDRSYYGNNLDNLKQVKLVGNIRANTKQIFEMNQKTDIITSYVREIEQKMKRIYQGLMQIRQELM